VNALRRQRFNCDQALHLAVFGKIHAAHAAGTEQAQQFVFSRELEAFVLAFEKQIALPSSNVLCCD